MISLSSLSGMYILLLLALSTSVDGANWNTGVRPLVTERLDPLISPNAVASHMHSIIGGSAFGAAYNQADLMKSSCTSFPISVDKSNYWHPKPYWINGNGSSFTPMPISNRVYYIREKNSPNDPIQPFPEGLRMIVGNPASKSPNSRSFQYLCRVAEKFNGEGDIWSDHWNFERDCPRGILAQHKFPPCWDGVNLYKSDQSHMAFPQWGAHYGACPSSHPIRLPGIMLETYINTYRWAPGEAIKGKLAWANGDTTGYGIHADFTNGWDTAVLARALNDSVCSSSADMTFQECPVFQPFIRDQACSPDKGVMAESFTHTDMVPIARLPGCNPLWASGPKPTCSPMPSNPDVSNWKGTDGPYVAEKSLAAVLPTVAGWKEISCIKDSDQMLSNKIRYYDPNVTQTSCLDGCLRSGYKYASIGYAWGTSWVCDCGTGIDPAAPMYPGMCNLTCPSGPAGQSCGGTAAHSVFYAPDGTSTAGQYNVSMGCYTNPPTGKVGLEQVSTYNFTSWNLMTRELCGQACADRGLDWGGIRSGGICFCGKKSDFNLGAGYYVNEAICSSKCAGDKSQSCGYWGGLSLFNVTTSGLTSTTLYKAPGYVQCYSDGARTSLTGAQYWDGNQSPERCQQGCRDLGFGLASVYDGSMCLCGDKLNNGATLPTSMCSTKCASTASNYTCGGPGAGELYNTSAVAAVLDAVNSARPSGWLGCYANSANNVTADITVNEGKLTASKCLSACSELGYGYAGVMNREQCRCSKADPRKSTKRVAAINYCAIPCNGDTTQTCGGWNYVDLYYNSPSNTTSPGQTAGGAVPTQPGYVGCMNGTAPLPAYRWSSSSMTIEICQKGCKEIGQPLAALYGGTCSCGAAWTQGPRLTSLSCSMSCGGDATQKCGGWQTSSSVFRSESGADTPKVPGYLGCWAETSPVKALQGYGVWVDSQSVDSCRAICLSKNFALSGLNNGRQCWCGNTLNSTSVQAPSQFCSNPCPGNSSQQCGQWNTIALWRSADTGSVDVPALSASGSTPVLSSVSSRPILSSSVTASRSSINVASVSSVSSVSTVSARVPVAASGSASISSVSRLSSNALSTAPSMTSSAVPSSSASSASSSSSPLYVGCYSDSSTRLLTGYTSNWNQMTRQACISACQTRQFKYAGLSSSTQCFCSNALNAAGGTNRLVSDSECRSKCGGSADMCGGTWRVSLFDLAPAAALSSMSTSSFSSSVSSARSSNSSIPLMSPSSAAAPRSSTTAAASSSIASASSPSLSSSARSTSASLTSATPTSSASPRSSTSTASGSSVSSRPASSPASASMSNQSATPVSVSSIASSASFVSSAAPYASISAPANSTYLGCFTDSSSGRTLPDLSTSNSKMTNEMCQSICASKGYYVYGTQYITQCYCSSVTPSLVKKVADSQCNTGCGGDGKSKCGGAYRLSVFGPVTQGTQRKRFHGRLRERGHQGRV